MEYSSPIFRTALEGSPQGFLFFDQRGSVAWLNQSIVSMLGLERSQLIGISIYDFLDKLKGCDSENLETLRNLFGSAESVRSAEVIFTAEESKNLHWQVTAQSNVEGRLTGLICEVTDLTPQRMLEEGVRQSQKMAAVGRLSMGISHDFNNLLTGINGNLAIFEMEARGQRNTIEGWENFHFAQKAGHRAGELVKQLLGFSRSECQDLNEISVNDVVLEVQGITKASISPSIQIDAVLEKELWSTLGDSNMISQVLINMATNARDALGESGTICFRTENVQIDEEQAKRAAGEAGEFVQITVEDNGEGMPPEVKEKIFTPFFTTKEKGKGTGLGLATSIDIVRQHRGWVSVSSEKGVGTKFEIFLPRASHFTQKNPLVPFKEPKPLPQHGNVQSGAGETVLVVDDEEAVRNVAVVILKKMGYHVHIAEDGHHALEVYADHCQDIDLVMLDLTMPKLSGQQTFAALREQFGYMPILICSGYLLDLTAFKKETGGCPDGFVQKPYQIEALTSSVRKVLDNSNGTDSGGKFVNSSTQRLG